MLQILYQTRVYVFEMVIIILNFLQQCEQMHIKAIQIKESILGKDHSEVALSLGYLASLYTYQMKKYKEAEPLLLRSKTICE